MAPAAIRWRPSWQSIMEIACITSSRVAKHVITKVLVSRIGVLYMGKE